MSVCDRSAVGAGRRRDVRGRRGRAPAGRRRGDGRGRVQHRARGYQEILTDPSYAGQIITFTYPHIGNYGVNERDDEARAPRCRGVIVRDLAPAVELARDRRSRRVPQPQRGPGHRRDRHAPAHAPHPQRGRDPGRVRVARSHTLLAAAQADGGTDGCDLASAVTTPEPYTVGPDDASLFVVAYDFGIKRSILDQLVGAGCQVEVVPAGTSGADVLARAPDGVFLSNGPGDPAAVGSAARQRAGAPRQRSRVRHLPRPPDHEPRARRARRSSCASVTTAATIRCGICRRAGSRSRARTTTTRSTATTLPEGSEVTHLNLNDGDVEGVRSADLRAFSVQYHPEAGPGPHDARYLFEEFTQLMRAS